MLTVLFIVLVFRIS